MNKHRLYKQIATLGYLGYLPAPGTSGSLVSMPILYYSMYCPWYPLTALLIIIGSFFVISKALHVFDEYDPSCVIIDEVAGMFCGGLVVWFGYLPLYHQHGLTSLLILFVLFRIFDITKIGFSHLEKYCTQRYGALAVLFDDLLAGALAAFTLYVVLVCFQ